MPFALSILAIILVLILSTCTNQKASQNHAVARTTIGPTSNQSPAEDKSSSNSRNPKPELNDNSGGSSNRISSSSIPSDSASFKHWQFTQRQTLTNILGLPKTRCPLEPEKRGQVSLGDVTIEKWTYSVEPGCRVPALLYLPSKRHHSIPAIVLTYGHGESKSHPAAQYIGQLYAKLGIACLCIDPLGEEERSKTGEMHTRSHDRPETRRITNSSGRAVMGKLVWDTMRSIDFLSSRKEIDSSRVGVGGNSLGGAEAGWLMTLEPKLYFAVISGWAFDDQKRESKKCTETPEKELRKLMSWSDYLVLVQPNCRVLNVNGESDGILDKAGDGRLWMSNKANFDEANAVLRKNGLNSNLETWLQDGGGHRPYLTNPYVVRWVIRQVFPAKKSPPFKTTIFGDWCKKENVQLEPLYAKYLNYYGAKAVDQDNHYLSPKLLRVLKDNEIGKPEYSLDGWLRVISKH